MKRYIYTLLMVLSVAGLPVACIPEVLEDNGQQDTASLRPGERLVNLSLSGLAGNGAVGTRSANGTATRATNESLTLAGECDIETLLIACFVNQASGGSTVTNPGEYPLERLYRYRHKGDANDFLLLSDAGGYHAGIGVPQNDGYKRMFLLFANPGEETLTETEMATYANALALAVNPAGSGATPASGLEISCPLPMGAVATHRVISSYGTITNEPVFTQADLERGVSARMIRRVSRIDLLNPDVTGFKAESMQVKAAASMPYFGVATANSLSDAYGEIALTNEEAVYGASYLLPATTGTQVEVTLTGALMGAPAQTLTARAEMKPNTRYLLRVRNDESNVRVEIEVADWDAGEDISTEDVSGKLNAGCTVAAVKNDESDNLVTLNEEKHTIYVAPATNITSGRTGLVTLTGATGDTNPIGVIIPDDCDWLDTSEPTTTAESRWQVTLKAAEKADATTRGPSRKIVIASLFQRPHTVPVSFVSRTTEGTLRFDTYELTVDVDPPISNMAGQHPVKVAVTAEGYWQSLVRIDTDAHTIHLPSVPDVSFSVRGYKEDGTPASWTSAYLSRDCSWLGQSQRMQSRAGAEIADDKLFMVSAANLTGSARATELITGTYDGTASAKIEQPWDVVQESGYDENLLAADALLELPLMEQEELSMTGNVISRSGFPITFFSDFYSQYTAAIRAGNLSTAEAIRERIAFSLKNLENSDGEKGDVVAYIYPSGSSPAEVTADVSWINITYKKDDTGRLYVVLDLELYLPMTAEAIDNPVARSGTVTIRLNGGRTRTYIIRQEQIKGGYVDVAEEM